MSKLFYATLFSAALLSLSPAIAPADRLIMKDGTVYEGHVFPLQGEKYTIRLPAGTSRSVPAADVTAVVTDTTLAAAKTPHAEFAAIQKKAEESACPIAAVLLFQRFLETHPTGADADAATKELENWKKLADQGAEKIGGKWVSGPDRQAILAKATAVWQEVTPLNNKGKNPEAVKKLEEALKIYPNSYPMLFQGGLFSIIMQQQDNAIKYWEQSLKWRPDSPQALNNIGVVYAQRTQFEQAAQYFYKAAVAQESESLAKNLAKAMAGLSTDLRNSARLRPAADALRIMASHYNLNIAADLTAVPWNLMQATANEPIDGALTNPALISGTGVIVGADGLIITNRHLVDQVDNLMVILDNGQHKIAQVVAVSPDLDLALLKIKTDAQLPVVEFSKSAAPPAGMQCFIIGESCVDHYWPQVQFTPGALSEKLRPGGDVSVEQRVSPGHTGGPVLDRFGQLIGISTFKGLPTGAADDNITPAISTAKVRAFLEKNKHLVTPAEPGKAVNAAEAAIKVKPAMVCIVGVR